ncbi:MAG: hypothetical protein RI568_16065, partial [Natronomonas sp.]|uniref:hypothetical protein n=1 Tax=Natronomonas sp. TaxID=2184060 RepID=UPI0028709D55
MGVSNPVSREALGVALRNEHGRQIVNEFRSVTGLYEFDVDEDIRNFEFDESMSRGDVLFPIVQGSSWGATYIYCILAHAFRCRGYRPIVLVCHADITPLCHKKDSPEDGATTCELCHYFGSTFFDAFGLETVMIGEFLPNDYEIPQSNIPAGESVVRDGVKVSDYAEGSASAWLRKLEVSFDDSEEQEIYNRFLQSGLILVDAGEALFQEFDFNAVVGSHSGYIYSGVTMEQAHQRDVPVVTFSSGFREQKLIFGNMRNRNPQPVFTDQEFVKEAISEPLAEAEKQAIDKFMNGRKTGTSVRTYSFHTGDATETLRLPADTVNLGLFSNLMWDASLLQADVAFDDPYDWISTTIDEVGGRDDLHLVVKPHPAEAARGTDQNVREWFEEAYDSPPDNVEVLPPDTNVDPYALLPVLDVSIVYNSTIGLRLRTPANLWSSSATRTIGT